MTFHIGYPQAIYLVLMLLADVLAIAKHGQPRDVKYNGPLSVLGTIVGCAILYWGGFFN